MLGGQRVSLEESQTQGETEQQTQSVEQTEDAQQVEQAAQPQLRRSSRTRTQVSRGLRHRGGALVHLPDHRLRLRLFTLT